MSSKTITQCMAIAAALIGCVSAECAPVTGDFNITQLQLYPENMDWNPINCKLYTSSLFNATGFEYDPYTGESKIITFPGISGNSDYHISGVTYDSPTGNIYFTASSATAFSSLGTNLTGPNTQIYYNPFTSSIIYSTNMDTIVASIRSLTGFTVGGFQDQAQINGVSYIIATYGNAIAKVTKDGCATVFYATAAPVLTKGSQTLGWNGIFAAGNKLVLADSISGGLITFDTTATLANGTGVAVNVNVTGGPSGYKVGCDRIYAPAKYNNQIALCSEDGSGTTIFKSTDNWTTASYLGLVSNNVPAALTGFATATVQIGNSIYSCEEFFADTGSFDLPGGKRTVFPFLDLTSKVDAIVGTL